MIKVTNLSKSYGKNIGLSNFSYDFEQGYIYGLIGPNGAGKTTLIKLITEFLKKDKGEIVKNFDRDTMLNNISYFPDFEVFIPGSVKKNIDFFTLTYADTDFELLKRTINMFEINIKDKVSDLSTGQKKAFRFALTIARKVKAYILDEPFANIDIDTRSKFIKLIFENIDIENSVVIISSHELHDMDSLLDEVLLIKNSELITSANADEIRQSSSLSLSEWYLKNINT